MSDFEIRQADLTDPAHARGIVELIAGYARGPGGGNVELSDEARAKLVPGLAALPTAFVLLALEAGRPVGVAVCVEGFSTFAGAPSINLHDLAVAPERQGRGIGSALLDALADRARERGARKVTLEVHEANEGGQRLYARHGFRGLDSKTFFLTLPLE
jgi:ribosomal protein S18 acetylase RimI-like enzyme